MIREITKLAEASAAERGREARRDGLGLAACPFLAQSLRMAWAEGWTAANMRCF